MNPRGHFLICVLLWLMVKSVAKTDVIDDVKVEGDAKTDSDAKRKSEVKVDSKTKIENDARVEKNTKIENDEAKIENDAKTEGSAKMDSDVKPQSKAKLSNETEVDSEVDIDDEMEMDSDVGMDGEDGLDRDLDRLTSIKETMDRVVDNVGGKKDCFYTCPNGAKPVSKKGHIPKSNGCGSFGVKVETKHVPGIARCCDKHDVCYDTCNATKDQCDDDFKTCLVNMCDAFRDYVTDNVYDGCKTSADIMYAATVAVGCQPYLDAQEQACSCLRENDEL